MNFTTKALIEKIDEAIELREKEATEYNIVQRLEHSKRLARWMEDRMPLWVQFAKTISDANENDLPVTKEDLPRGLLKYGEFKFWTAGEFIEREPDIEKLVALRSALTATTDDTVTTRGLAELGFRDLNSLFRF